MLSRLIVQTRPSTLVIFKAIVHVAQILAESPDPQATDAAAGLAPTMAESESGSMIPGNGSVTGKHTFSGTATRRALTSASTAAAAGPVGIMKTTMATGVTGHTMTTGGCRCLLGLLAVFPGLATQRELQKWWRGGSPCSLKVSSKQVCAFALK